MRVRLPGNGEASKVGAGLTLGAACAQAFGIWWFVEIVITYTPWIATVAFVPVTLTLLSLRSQVVARRAALLAASLALEVAVAVLVRDEYWMPLDQVAEPLPEAPWLLAVSNASWIVWHIAPWVVGAALATQVVQLKNRQDRR